MILKVFKQSIDQPKKNIGDEMTDGIITRMEKFTE